MNTQLLLKACTKFAVGLLLTGLLLFLPAGTLLFPNAWLFLALLFIPMFFVALFLYFKAPELLQKRMQSKEAEPEQRRIIAYSALVFTAGFVLAGLDYRLGWSHLPVWLVMAAAVLLFVSYALYVEVMRENAFLSRTVEVQQNQRVIDTGLYGIVRHPMYFATVLLYIAIPIVLGSVCSFIVFLAYIPLIVCRILSEEAFLAKELDGYAGYMQRVKYRLIPFVW